MQLFDQCAEDPLYVSAIPGLFDRPEAQIDAVHLTGFAEVDRAKISAIINMDRFRDTPYRPDTFHSV
ncbi:hypothetical protein D3C72_2157630 [compost metagenome]